MDRANAGAKDAENCLRILTPLLKFRACRDNIPVATGAMEVRGGNGYIEEWVQARLVRDAHIGVLWEGTSNINALDIITRAVGKSGAHKALETALLKLLDQATAIPAAFRDRLRQALDRDDAFRRARRRGSRAGSARAARGERALSHHQRGADDIGGQPSEADARRALCARLVLEHRLGINDPLAPKIGEWEDNAAGLLSRSAARPLRRLLACSFNCHSGRAQREPGNDDAGSNQIVRQCLRLRQRCLKFRRPLQPVGQRLKPSCNQGLRRTAAA